MIELSIGLVIILIIIGVPVYVLILASMFGKPRNLAVTGYFLLTWLCLLVMFVIFTWFLGKILTFIVPQG